LPPSSPARASASTSSVPNDFQLRTRRFWYPECDEADLRATLTSAAELEPITIFHEPINIRAENVARIETHAKSLGVELKTDVFATRASWQDYAIASLRAVHNLSREAGVEDRLHLWPDKSLGNKSLLSRLPNPNDHLQWLRRWWGRVSEWPK